MDDEVKTFVWGCSGVFFLVIIVWLLSCFTSVPTGNVGIVTQFGRVTGREIEPGFAVKAPWPFQDVTVMNTQVQKEQQDADASSSDLQEVKATVAVNYHLNRGQVSQIFSNVGIDYKTKVIDPAIQEGVKSVTAKYNATDLISNRSAVKDAVEATLTSRLLPYGITVDATSIVNFGFSDAFNKAIEDKQVASQNVLQEQQKLDQIKVQAQETVTNAQATHDSNALLEQSLTPAILQKMEIDKWDGKLPVTNAGSAIPFLSLTTK